MWDEQAGVAHWQASPCIRAVDRATGRGAGARVVNRTMNYSTRGSIILGVQV